MPPFGKLSAEAVVTECRRVHTRALDHAVGDADAAVKKKKKSINGTGRSSRTPWSCS